MWAEKRQLPVETFLADPLSALAAVILFDQFPRNMFRGHADQFATDHLALAVAKAAVDRDFDNELERDERCFLYMPFQHSENLADQNRGVLLFSELGDDNLLGFAKKHRDIIERFGRFPHRNAMSRPGAASRRNRRRRRGALVSGLVEAARFNWAYQAELARTFLESHGFGADRVRHTRAIFYSDGRDGRSCG